MFDTSKLYNLREAQEIMKIHGLRMTRSDYGSTHQLSWDEELGEFRYHYGNNFLQCERAKGVLYEEGRVYAIVKVKLKGNKPWTD